MSGERLYHDPDFKTALNNLGERVGGGKGPGLGAAQLNENLVAVSPCSLWPDQVDPGIQFRCWPQAHPSSGTLEKPACI